MDLEVNFFVFRTHLFGESGNHNLNFEEFCTFVKNIQREVLRVEFLGYSQVNQE